MREKSARGALSHVRANAVAYLALFVALGGTSAYAAGAMPKASVGARQLKPNAVTSPKVKDGSLRATDFAAGQLPRGERGTAGERGPAGPQGERGPSGFSAFGGEIPSGTTLSGYFDQQLPLATGKKAAFGVSFQVPLAANQPAAVSFAPGSGAAITDPTCSGNVWVPTAPPGKVCVYSAGSSGSTGFESFNSSNHGFVVSFTSTGSNNDFVSFSGTWAYTAP